MRDNADTFYTQQGRIQDFWNWGAPPISNGYASLAPRIPFLTVNQPFEITRLARQYDISSTLIGFFIIKSCWIPNSCHI